jgi:hypothetical protein
VKTWLGGFRAWKLGCLSRAIKPPSLQVLKPSSH